MTVYLGIDNGVTGSLAYISTDGGAADLAPTPTKKEQSYTKKKQRITRIDHPALVRLLSDWFLIFPKDTRWRVLLERPYANPQGLKATVSGMRALESTLIAIEAFGIAFEYIDSRAWQKELLPSGIKGTAELKHASEEIGCRLFPHLRGKIEKHGDADALLIAEWARRNQR